MRTSLPAALRPHLSALLLGGLPVAAGCGAGESLSAMGADVAERDSAGIRIVERMSFADHFGDDYVLGLWRDDMDVEYVRMYGLEKDG